MNRIASRAFLAALFAMALGMPATRSDTKTITVDLFMVDYKFIPDHLTFLQGMHYRLHMENHGKETHEVTAPTFFGSAALDNPDVLNREHTEIVMQPGDVKDLLFTAPKAGTYDLRCSDHDWNGMIGGITVE
ncbi:MAG TPA: cupredoxin domain-containing protein [Tepidisphaeraceae bacterium]|nr:cupredoxin domain-containing protein [Tepidisphaeraceae bacterium]